MIKGQIYMHKQAKDVALEILEKETPVRIHVNVWNLGYSGEPWLIDRAIFNIRNPEDYQNITADFKKKRTKDGPP